MKTNIDSAENIEAEAAEWVIRLGGQNLSATERKHFEAWIAQGPMYHETFNLANGTWRELGTLGTDGFIQREEKTKPWVQTTILQPTMAGIIWPRAVFGLSLAIALFIGGFAFWYGDPVTMLTADYIAETGEMRTVTLPDGSLVDLASGSAIALAYDETSRNVRLIRGEAYFTAMPIRGAEVRPFTVKAGEITTTAIGTQFMVDKKSDAIDVTVTEHDVRVHFDDQETENTSIVVSEGQSVRYRSQKGFELVQKKNTGFATAWRNGKLIFVDQPLGEVVEELNRYRRGRIVIRSAKLAQRRVSGIFYTKDISSAVTRIASELNLSVMSLPPIATILY